MKYIFFFVSMAIILGNECSCVSTRRAAYILEKRGELATICSKKFPTKDSIIYHEYEKVDTVYFISDSIRFRDTIVCNRDTIIRSKEFICPTSKVIIRTLFKDSVVYRENTAKIQDLQDKLDKETATAQDTQKSLQTWRWRAIVFIALSSFLLLVILKSIFKWI